MTKYYLFEIEKKGDDYEIQILDFIATTLYETAEELTTTEYAKYINKNSGSPELSNIRFITVEDEENGISGILYFDKYGTVKYINYDSVNCQWILTDEVDEMAEAAERVYKIMDPWERYDTTPEEIAESIKTKPIDTIKYLLDFLDKGEPEKTKETDTELLKDIFETIGDPWTENEEKTIKFYNDLLTENPTELIKILLENVKMWQKVNDEN